jgi:hypothetical protein
VRWVKCWIGDHYTLYQFCSGERLEECKLSNTALDQVLDGCPQGNYFVDDGYLDTAMVEDMQVFSGFWQVRLVYAYKGRPLMCVKGNGELRQRRRKKSKQTKG